jgi:uncharacterized protein (DUF1015 family)
VAHVRPFRGIRYNPELVRLGGVLAPPYDVIDDTQRDALYGRDLRNIVRVDYGVDQPGDVPGARDRYTRASGFLTSWLELGVLVREAEPAIYVSDHEFTHPDGAVLHRRGILTVTPAVPWERSDLRPHERTMRAPKEDRLSLLRATRVQTSPVFALWAGAAGAADLIARAAVDRALLGGRTDGELGSEKHLLWKVERETAAAFVDALAPATLYVADGHHRYETAVGYAAERASSEPDAPAEAPFRWCLVYLSAADDPGLTILPTHRLVRPGPGIAYSLDDLWARLDDAWDEEAVGSVPAALARCAELRDGHHAFAAVAGDGVAVLRRPRHADASPREALDAVVLETEVLAPAGVRREAIAAGALAYTRDAAELARAVADGDAVLGFGMQPVRAAEVIAVADSGETLPQKSTYFYPKVPTGLVLHPV